MAKKRQILVLGIGNILLGDEGVGVHAVRYLEKKSLPGQVALLDGGTGGFHLLSVFQQYEKIILIDATLDGNKPGKVSILRPKFAKDFPPALSSHEIGLKDLLQSSELLGYNPEIILITVSISDDQPVSMELSDEVKRTFPEIEAMVNKLILES